MFNRHQPTSYQGSTLDLFTTAFELAKMVTQEFEDIERRNRHDDCQAKLVNNAHRLYEQGKISKEQFIAIIQQLPSNSPVIDVDTQSSMAQPKPTAQDLIDLLNKM